MGKKAVKERREAATLKKREAKVSATPTTSNDLVDSSVKGSSAPPDVSKPSSCTSSVNTQVQATSTSCQTRSSRPHSTSAAVTSKHPAGDAPIHVTTPDVDPKFQSQPGRPRAQAAVKYLVSQVKTFNSRDHNDSDVSNAGHNNFGSTNGDDDDDSCADDNDDKDEEIAMDEGCVSGQEVNRNALGDNRVGIIAWAGQRNVKVVPEKKVNHNNDLSSDSDLDNGKHNK